MTKKKYPDPIRPIDVPHDTWLVIDTLTDERWTSQEAPPSDAVQLSKTKYHVAQSKRDWWGPYTEQLARTMSRMRTSRHAPERKEPQQDATDRSAVSDTPAIAMDGREDLV